MFKRRDGSLRDAMEAASDPVPMAADLRMVDPEVAALDQIIRAFRSVSPELRGVLADLAARIVATKEGDHDGDGSH